MKRWRWLTLIGLCGCATTAAPEDRPRTIEPVGAESSGGQEGDDAFVLSREGKGKAKAQPAAPLHIGDQWWRFRAEFLNMTESQAKDRDAAISERQAPANFWDKQTALETVEIWGHLCNECHGGRRHLKDAMSMPAPPAGWGAGDGLFFGNRRDYSAVFAIINMGGPERNGKRSPMPAWSGKLAKEEMWALLYFLEYQSGGIEGRFPPSLYPRPLDAP
ncbi:MAG TPA: cytochrome c [Polyangia bacterium]|jgi:hypothetical protein|nr:cytochrome c [Polyangia bacterium]